MIYKKYSGFHYTPPIPFELTAHQQILLMPIGDIHFGAKDFPTKHFVTTIKWASDRGATFLGMGEYLDFTSASQRQVTNQLRESQLEKIDDWVQSNMEELFDLISFTRGRWLGLLEGDHRWTFETGISGDQYLAEKLACDFLGTSALLRLDAGIKDHPEADTIVFAHHGVGGGSTAGGHLNAVERKLKDIEADIYLMGHSHAKLGTPLDRQYISPDGVHYHRTKLLARTGSFYKAYKSMPPLALDQPAILSRGTYAEQRAYTPAAMGSICIGIGCENIPHSEYYCPTIHYSI
jgi:hypothetical protein